MSFELSSALCIASPKCTSPLVPLTEIGSSLTYTYDLGDGWEHTIVLEKRFCGSDDTEYPVCLDGRQACPPEDSGGVPGYYDLLEVLQNLADERYEEMREWIGGEFDPRAFSLEAVNRRSEAGGFAAEAPLSVH